MREVYLDNAATTKPKYFAYDYKESWHNVNANYSMDEKRKLQQARDSIKASLGLRGGKIIFCRCATEAVEWLVRQYRKCTDRGRVTGSPYEHDSVYDLYHGKYYKPTNSDMYLHQYVNQLTGTIFNLEYISRIVKDEIGFLYFVSDFTAAIGHAPIPENLESYCDALWFSGHKIGCEKGIGAIWIGDQLYDRFTHGETHSTSGNYELLQGTTSVESALALATAVEATIQKEKEQAEHNLKLFESLKSKLHNSKISYKVVTENTGNQLEEDQLGRSKAINSIVLRGINANALQMYLSTKNIYIGIGASACSAADDYRVLEAFGLSRWECEHAIRVSFSLDNTESDIDALVNGIVEYKNKFISVDEKDNTITIIPTVESIRGKNIYEI